MLEKFRRGICDDECVKMLAGCGTKVDTMGDGEILVSEVVGAAAKWRNSVDHYFC